MNPLAINFKTTTPNKLLRTYKKAIDDGHVSTWSYDADGDFTHTASQWIREAWMRPKIVPNQELVFYIIKPQATPNLSSLMYAVYHGRFIESMLRHCDGLFVYCGATSMPEGNDVT